MIALPLYYISFNVIIQRGDYNLINEQYKIRKNGKVFDNIIKL